MATPIPSNQTAFSTAELELALGVRASGSTARSGCVGVTTDSRGDVTGKLFVALSGERFDGHKYVSDVLARGAYGVVVERAHSGSTNSVAFHVDSTLDALGALARAHRMRWGGRVITIGGSAGKTTTRTAVQAFLSALCPGKVHGTTGNLNNLVGVPMTLLSARAEHQLAVIEVGTNQLGEVSRLARICAADVALLTCIGLEHSEGLGDLDGIEREESALFTELRAGAAVVGLADDERVTHLVSRAPTHRKVTYGLSPTATHCIVERKTLLREQNQIRIRRDNPEGNSEITLRTRLCGLPGALASAAAVAVADALGISIEQSIAERALDRQIGEAGRLRIAEREDRALVIDDCYNANPISMRSSFGVARELAKAEGRRLFFVLGEMRELGDLSHREHEALAEQLDGVEEVVAVGPEMAPFVARAKDLQRSVCHFENSETAAAYVARAVRPNDVVLVKGSRGVQLERVVSVIARGEGNAQ